MLHVYYGTDIPSVREHALTFAHSAGVDVRSIARITPEGYVPGSVRDAISSTSLFGERRVVVFDMPSTLEEMQQELVEHLAECAASEDVFVCIEGKLLAAQRKVYEKHAAAVEEYTGVTPERFNTFGLTDALLKKDKKQLWMLLMQARANGIVAEEAAGVLFWQLKTLMLAATCPDAATAGLKPFVYTKAKRALSHFSDGEIETLTRSLLAAYHDGHSGVRDIDLALEEWVLSI